MSWLSKGIKAVGKGVKKVGSNLGKVWEAVDDYALPAVGFALGGPPGAALGGAAAGALGNGKPTLGKVAGGAATGGLTALTGGFGAAAGAGAATGAAGAAQGLAKSAGGSTLGKIWNAAGGLEGVANLGMTGLGMYQGAQDAKKADKKSKQLEAIAMAEWNAGAPLRDRARQLAMQNPGQAPNLSSIFYDAGNPYARRVG